MKDGETASNRDASPPVEFDYCQRCGIALLPWMREVGLCRHHSDELVVQEADAAESS